MGLWASQKVTMNRKKPSGGKRGTAERWSKTISPITATSELIAGVAHERAVLVERDLLYLL